MLWTIAYSQSYTAAQTDADIPLLNDATVAVDSGSHPLLPTRLYEQWIYGLGNTLSRVRRSAPKFRPISRSLVRPIEQAANPSSRPIFQESFRHPILYQQVEPIAMLVTNNAPMGGERNFVILTLGDGNHNSPPGDLYTLRFTTAFTPVANAWSASGNMTFDDSLMGATYAIIGFDMWSVGGVAARLIFSGPPLPGMISMVRPGIIVPTVVGAQSTRYFRYGYLGEFGRFNSFAPPQAEVLFTAATANPEGYLDVVVTQAGITLGS